MTSTTKNSTHFRRPALACLVILLAGLCGLISSGCGSKEQAAPAKVDVNKALLPKFDKNIQIPTVGFTDITEKAGIHFIHCNGAFGKKLLPETMGSGVAFIDYDNDGLQDIIFVNSCYWPGYEDGKPQPMLALYRNKGKGEFEDVTDKAGLAITLYGMGVTVGDYDN